jgi:carboxymethylenebutenolidase
MALMTAEPAVRHQPTGAGASGAAAVRRFYTGEFFPALPADLSRARLSRTVDRFRLAEETTVSFTHDRELPWLLPGIEPTYRPAEVLAITVVDFQRGKISNVRTLWDHATLTAQLGVPSLAAASRPASGTGGRFG